MAKLFKILALIFLSLSIAISFVFFAFVLITRDAVLDPDKLKGAGQTILIYDENGEEITSASLEIKNKSVAVRNLSKDTINAFIASEDRTFFKHNGLNYKRMLKALYKNVVSRSFKEGASTISQQLIKNTHLSNDKTIKRKLNEIKLTLKLEKKYSKDEILEMYLNTIYFGHNCYGLESASEFYFNKRAENLELTESATIVGLLTSPNNFSPFKNPEKSLARRNLVLKSMLDCGYITEYVYSEAVKSPLNAEPSEREDKYGDYLNAVFDELEDIDFDYYALKDGCSIITYLNRDIQKFIENIDYSCDNSVIVTDNSTAGIKAFKSTVNGAKRQPGSTVKPIFVYAPAIEERQLSPFTKILDEKIDFNGYSPENYDKQYHGYVTVEDSIKQSYNIPAVKTLNALTLQKCEKYLTAMDVKLDEDEKNLSLALGGMKYGLTLKEIADKYSVFPESGNYRPSRFIKEIVSKDGKRLYEHQPAANKVFSQGTCSLINQMLIETSQSGTAKKLKTFDFNIASKTGTCGNQDGNTDAYAVSYTSENCMAVWLGDKDNVRTDITGGKDCCAIMKQLIEKLYSDHSPAPLDTDGGTVKIDIDREEYSENNRIVIADPACPKLNIMTVSVLKGNEPQLKSYRFSNPTISKPLISVQNGSVSIELCYAKYYSFIVKRAQNNQIDTVFDGKWQKIITDTPDEGLYTYSVTPYFENNGKKYYGKEVFLSPVNLKRENSEPPVKIPEIINKDWFNL